ncbi:MAG: hypothetical protein JXR75_04720 [Rhodobacteraceae bacterium]|nr:hypothetical protein [Paracoccaceae bacterium]
MSKARVRLHVPAHMLPDGPEDLPAFYRNLMEQLAALGARCEVVHRDMEALRNGPDGADFDFVHNGNIDRPQALNLGPAYLSRFFYADAKGIFFESSIAGLTFRPAAIPVETAAGFAATLRGLFVAPRKSRHPQPTDRAQFKCGHIAVFLQDLSDPVLRARHMPARAMIETILSDTGGRQVVVKPHPRNTGDETQAICDWLGAHHPQVCLTTANVHDILQGAALSASIASSVAVEGMLHGVPAVLFGRSDLHHCAETVVTPADWPMALDRALGRDWPFDAFLFWFLKRQCIWATRPFLRQILDRMSARGADFARLGVTLPSASG